MPLIVEPIKTLLQQAEAICGKLSIEARRIDLNHAFTLDGRFVGDIGELLAAQHFAFTPHPNQKGRHDGTCLINGREHGVQVKCRRASTVIDFTTQPDILLVIEIDKHWRSWEVAYNGPGSIVTRGTDLQVSKTGKLLRNRTKTSRRLHLDDLREASDATQKLRRASHLAVPKRSTPKLGAPSLPEPEFRTSNLEPRT
jgi:hypothetical protein